jgi:hypothetical protein
MCVEHLGVDVIEATGTGLWLTDDWLRLSDLMAGNVRPLGGAPYECYSAVAVSELYYSL